MIAKDVSDLISRRLPSEDLRIEALNITKITIVSLIVGLAISMVSLVATGSPDITLFILIMITLLPPAWLFYLKRSFDREIRSKAPEFFYDLSEQVKASGSLVKALKRVARQNYGSLSDEILRMLSEVEHEGYDIQRSLSSMALRLNNSYMTRAVSVINEGLRSSSDIDGILKNVSAEGRLYRSLEKERISGLSSAIFVIYLTSVIFLFVVSLSITSFIPLSNDIAPRQGDLKSMVMPYFILSLSVALCSGFTVGMLRDLTVFGGFKDAALLVALTFAVYEMFVFTGFSIMGVYGI